MKRLTIQEQKDLGDIYDQIMINEMESVDVLGPFITHNRLENQDDYATGDQRIPKLLGGVQTRKGMIKKKKKSKKSA